MITSKSNAFIKSVRALKDKKERDLTGLFTADGAKLVREAFISGQNVFAVIGTNKGLSLISDVDLCGVKTEEVSEEVFKSISDEVTPQGVLAVIKKPQRPLRAPESDCLFLDGVSDPANVGAIIRTAAATGFCDVYMAEGADAYSPKAIRSSMSGIFRVNVFTGKREELAKYITVPAFVADMGGEDPFSVRREGNVCLIVGNEAHGVSEFMKNRADRTLGLDMQNGMESLNAAVAAGVLMYALTKK